MRHQRASHCLVLLSVLCVWTTATLAYVVAMVTAMIDDTLTEEALRREGGNEVPSVLMTQALKFWRSMDPALKAEAAEWKKMRGYDKGLMR